MIVKKLNDILPDLVVLESSPTKVLSISVLSALCDLRLRGIPDLEAEVKAVRDEVKKKLELRKINRGEKQTKQIYANFEKNIKSKKQNHE